MAVFGVLSDKVLKEQLNILNGLYYRINQKDYEKALNRHFKNKEVSTIYGLLLELDSLRAKTPLNLDAAKIEYSLLAKSFYQEKEGMMPEAQWSDLYGYHENKETAKSNEAWFTNFVLNTGYQLYNKMRVQEGKTLFQTMEGLSREYGYRVLYLHYQDTWRSLKRIALYGSLFIAAAGTALTGAYSYAKNRETKPVQPQLIQNQKNIEKQRD